MSQKKFNFVHNSEQELWRDAYGFALRPQHVQGYREYAGIYKEEEEERSQKWKNFLKHQEEVAQLSSPEEKYKETLLAEAAEFKEEAVSDKNSEGNEGEDSELKTIFPQKGRQGNEADATELKEETVSESGGQVDNAEGALKEEIVIERSRSTEYEGTKDTVSDRGREGDKAEATELKEETLLERGRKGDDSSRKSDSDSSAELNTKKEKLSQETRTHKIQTWAQIRPSLGAIENMMSCRVKKRKVMAGEQITKSGDHLPSIDEARSSGGESDEDIKEKVCVTETSYGSVNASHENISPGDNISTEPYFPWKKELECLVRGGVPKDLRGEVWQAFVGVKARRVQRYYQDLLAQATNASENKEHDNSSGIPRKWKRQIEKDIPRTFPGHPALNEDGRDSLRRLLLAYARHNPSVGYCQAMNFFAGLLLLLMPEENAFWTLVGIIDDYFDGYFTEEMIESQVDQLVFEDLIRERFPRLVNHLEYLGVQVTWIAGPWFLSIFVNILPWESVLRVWDVLLYEGNRVMLFRTALALMELYGPALVTTKDAGDAITLLQSLAGSTFDSSQLVLTACMGYSTVTEARLQELREKHRPSVLVVVEERSKGGQVSNSKGLASKLYSFKHEPEPLIEENKKSEELDDAHVDADMSQMEPSPSDLDQMLSGLTVNSELEGRDPEDQVVWLKVELCSMLEQKRSAVLRADELETALMEMVKQDNRRELSAMIEQLEQEVSDLRQALADKKEQESAMLQVLMKVEQEQKITEDARRIAEQDAAAQRYAVHVLEEKYEKAMASVAQMEKRVVMAESMLEATLQYESGQAKAISSPRLPSSNAHNQGPTVDSPRRKIGLFGLGWRDRNKGKQTNAEDSSDKLSNNQ
ncbi:TBC1 domain family member protein [Melia azedarach]|uniref:TBC1 domain family member protein n=1 Tax=Melia azedarach TaxID=155640 RepID=A0ACC1X0A3_MELAZ|nr:TBC1 domain family member protein [Melia azedarach]